jgi:hypothetical protein
MVQSGAIVALIVIIAVLSPSATNLATVADRASTA